MKKINIFLWVLSIMLALTACDSGLRYEKIEIVQLPTKLVYNCQDNRIDLTGGQVCLTTAEGDEFIVDLADYPFADKNKYGIYSNIDFDTPGVYQVIITQYDGVQCSFNIEVK